MADETKRVYQSTTLGMQALQMVLVHARNDAKNAAIPAIETPVKPSPGGPAAAALDTRQAVRKIIEHLKSIDA